MEMDQVVTWAVPILVAFVTGGFSYLGVVKTMKSSNEKQMIVLSQEISSIQRDIKRLEEKQDKHNSIIERTFKLEQKVDDMEKRIK